MTDAAKDAARTATNSPVVRALARGGYAATGVVHMLIGAIVLTIAGGGSGDSDQSGAFRAVAAAPLGFVALWVLAVLLWSLGIWHALEGIAVRRRSDVRKWSVRVSEWGQAIAFLALGTGAAVVALGARPDGDETAEDASRGILAVTGGPFILGAVGIGVAIGGVAFAVIGVRRSFRTKMSIPAGRLGTTVTMLGAVGFVAKGIALLIVGILLVVAAVRVDPAAAGGLDGAIQVLLAVFLGPVLVGLVGAGFVAYGVFCLFRARYARLRG